MLTHAREITAVTNQWVNSYKRLVGGFEAPVYVSWARNNRSVVVNVPPIKARQGRLGPHRVPGARPRLQPVPRLLGGAGRRPARASRRATSSRRRRPPTSTSSPRRSGWPRASRSLPGSLAEALDEMERSELVAEALGEHVFEWFIRNKRAEWHEYKTQVSQFELDRYLPRL